MTDSEQLEMKKALDRVADAVEEARNALLALQIEEKKETLRARHVAYLNFLATLTPPQRALLNVLSINEKENMGLGVPQKEYQRRLGNISAYELRSRLGGLAKACKKANQAYPICSHGSSESNRHFTIPAQLFAILNRT